MLVDVVERLETQARAAPDAPAVVERGTVTSYAAFLDRVRAFASSFSAAEARRVVIALEKGCDAYAAMFGALMAGATYAPVNISSPQARLRHICEVFDPDVIVATGPLAALVDPTRNELIDPAALGAPGPRVAARLDPRSLAYVIFTSGSTGAPKGVAIPRSALAHYVDWLGPAMAIGPGERMSQHPNIGFDLSVLDIYGALCWGAALYPFVEPSARLLPARKVEADKITIWNSVPSVISLMATAGELTAEMLASVRLFTFCGEVLRQDQVAGIFAARPDGVVLNTYGPTEATVAMTCRRLTAETHARLCQPSAPLGDAIGEMRLDLAGDDSGEGEIVISGPQLAAGYFGDAELSDAKFRAFAGPDGPVRAFYTGDYAARVAGELYFLGRRDDMVKLRGHRVHLGEVRRAFGDLGYADAFVFAKEAALLAVVEQAKERVFDEKALIAELASRLDSYFVPQAIRCVDRLPRSSNDKIDGAALKQLFAEV